MKKEEYYDPEIQNYTFYSSPEERASRQKELNKKKLENDRKRVKKIRRIILFDIVLLVLIFIFFYFARPFFLAQTKIDGYRVHISVLHKNEEENQLYGMIKVKNLYAENQEKMNFIVSYGSQTLELDIELPEKGKFIGDEVVFDLEEGVEYMVVDIQRKNLTKSAKVSLKRFSFL